MRRGTRTFGLGVFLPLKRKGEGLRRLGGTRTGETSHNPSSHPSWGRVTDPLATSCRNRQTESDGTPGLQSLLHGVDQKGSRSHTRSHPNAHRALIGEGRGTGVGFGRITLVRPGRRVGPSLLPPPCPPPCPPPSRPSAVGSRRGPWSCLREKVGSTGGESEVSRPRGSGHAVP